jgi:hypothetical protein
MTFAICHHGAQISIADAAKAAIAALEIKR